MNINDKEFLPKFNSMVRETIDHYYKHRDADSFFNIDDMLRVCSKNNLTINEVPALIEMQNIIVLG